MVGLDKQPVDTDASQVSGLASRFQKSMNVHRGTGLSAAVTLHQSFFVFYMFHIGEKHQIAKLSVYQNSFAVR